jgi:hypothetical protein
MSAQGSPKGEYRSAQHEGTPIKARHDTAALALRIDAAARANDWPALAAVDREVADVLRVIAKQGLRSTAEKAALQQLREAHRVSREICAGQAAHLGERLDELRARKEGWLAYSVSAFAADEASMPAGGAR